MSTKKVIRSFYIRESLLKEAQKHAKADKRSLNSWMDNQLEEVLIQLRRKAA